MLCRITMKNFVHFEKEQDLRFTPNCPVLFVGASSSGKTAALELIRRCLDSKINSSLTNRVDPNLMAYAFCEFSIDVKNDNDLKDYDKNVITGILVDENLRNDDEHKEDKTWVKTDLDEISLDETLEDGKRGDSKTDIHEGKKKEETQDENSDDDDEDEENDIDFDEISEDGKREDIRKDTQEDKKQEETKDEENSDDDDEHEGKKEWDETELLKSEQIFQKQADSENGKQEEKKNQGGTDVEGNVIDDGHKQIFHKIIIYKYKEKMKIRTKTFLEKEDGSIVDLRENLKLPDSLSKEFFENGNFEKLARDTLKYIKEKKGKMYRKKPKLWYIINLTYVGVLSMRGIGTFQYTSSRQIFKDRKDSNYMDTCKQAEIINDLMKNDLIDESKEEGIFNYLTDGKQIKFTINSDGDIIVERDGKSFPLLKTSVGILEAKQFSLLMAHRKLNTICFEEPDRGMHPQMIQRMKEILHQESCDKTIIVVTHSPFLVDSMSFENTYIFCAQENKMHFIKSYNDAVPKETASLSQIEEMKTLLFASKVLLVEGKSDEVVLKGIFRHIFKKHVSESFSESNVRYKNILSHQILSADGASSTKPVKAFCDEINVQCRVLLDRDAVITTDNRGCIENINEPTFNSFKEKTIWDFLQDAKGFDQLSRTLAENGKFIWKEGDLEDVLLSNKEHRKDIFKLLKIEPASKYRKRLKEEIKTKLLHGLTPKQSEELTKIIVEFDDVKRLLNFLGYL